jgi:exonuclease-1
MAYMVKMGYADFAVSEDSDLIAYGCPRLIMKLDHFGECKEFNHKHFKSFKSHSDETKKTGLETLQGLDR